MGTRVLGLSLTIILAGLLSGPGVWAEEPKPIVAVFQIQVKNHKIDADTLGALTDYLAAAISEDGALRVVPPGDIRAALKAKQNESFAECYDQKCQVELGRELAANKTLSTTVLKLGETCTVTTSLYDLRTKTTDVSQMADDRCDPAALKTAISTVAAKIRSWCTGEPPAPAAGSSSIAAPAAEEGSQIVTLPAPPDPGPPDPGGSGIGDSDPRQPAPGFDSQPAPDPKLVKVFERLKQDRRIEVPVGKVFNQRGAIRAQFEPMLDLIAKDMLADPELIFRIEAEVRRPKLIKPRLKKVTRGLARRGVRAYRLHRQQTRVVGRNARDRLFLIFGK